jgi:hypothetical protein
LPYYFNYGLIEIFVVVITGVIISLSGRFGLRQSSGHFGVYENRQQRGKHVIRVLVFGHLD